MLKIEIPFKKLEKIAQIADIHIRLYKRHTEYEEVFTVLYEQLRTADLHNGIILVVGDIVHAKTDMSPEMIHLASDFFRNLADIAPTFIVTGNHDVNLANVHRLDALTPIINNIQHPNLHYLKYSDVYNIGGVDFAVMSVLDDRTQWPTTSTCTSDTKIAVYHGPVYGAVTDSNYAITDRHVSVTQFDGFDMALLGDVHKYQVLQEYSELPEKKPIVAFAGSAIQQNHGEAISGHGWLLWNVETREHSFVPIPNPYGYCTLELVNGKLAFPSDMPDNVRLRLFTGDADETMVKKAISALRSKYNIIEMSINKSKYSSNISSTITNSNLLNVGDLTDVNVQNTLIGDWLEDKYGGQISSELRSKILDINKLLNSELTHEDHSRNIHWRPLELTFSNIFSYGEDNVITFTDLSGTYGIFAPNASGKSSAMEALTFALFDKTPRAFRGDHIMNNRKDAFDLEFTFEVGKSVYSVRRKGFRKKTGSVKVDVDFVEILPSGEIVSHNGADRFETNSNIRSLVGSYEDFILTAFSSQNSNSLFIDKSHSERKDLLNQFMGLVIFDKLEKMANEQSREVQGALRKFKQDDFTEILVNIQSDLDLLVTVYDETKAQYEAMEKQQVELDDTINDLYSKKLPVDISVVDLSRHNAIKQEIESKLKSLPIRIDKAGKNIEELQAQITKLPNVIRDEREVDAILESVGVTKTQLSRVDREISKLITTINNIRRQIQWLDTHEYDPNCEYCVDNIFFKEALREKDLLSKYESELTQQTELRADLIQTISGMETTMAGYKSELTIKNKLNDLKTKVLNIQLVLQQDKLLKETCERRLSDTESYIQQSTVQEQSIVHNKVIDDELFVYKQKKNDVAAELAELGAKLRDVFGQIEVSKSRKDEYIRKLSEATLLELEFEGYKFYLDAVGRDGVPYSLISKVIPNIESEINSILSQIVDFTITLEVDGKNINGKIVYDDVRVWPLENSSGMERFISALAIRVALMKASNLPKPNFLIIDEGMGTLDAENIGGLPQLLAILKTQFDFIIVISHLDVVRDMVDSLIEIKKEEGYSFIQYS